MTISKLDTAYLARFRATRRLNRKIRRGMLVANQARMGISTLRRSATTVLERGKVVEVILDEERMAALGETVEQNTSWVLAMEHRVAVEGLRAPQRKVAR